MGHVFAQNWSTYDVPPFVRCAVYSEVWGPNYKKQGVLAPDVVGGEIVWPQFRFFPLWAA